MAEPMSFDRAISSALLEAISSDGPLGGLLARRASDPGFYDVQLRREPRGTRSWATLYRGLLSVLSVDERKGQFRLRAHETLRKRGGFDPQWAAWQASSSLGDQWPRIDAYLDRLAADAVLERRYVAREGLVHAALCSGRSHAYRVIQREATIAFASRAVRSGICASLRAAVAAAVPGCPELGTELDVLAVDERGRLLIVEAKPAVELQGIEWSPAQAMMYALLFRRLLDQSADAVAQLNTMLEQRVALGLTAPGQRVESPVAVVPVVAIGAGAPHCLAPERLQGTSANLHDLVAARGLDPIEVWFLDAQGDIEERWLPSQSAAPPSVIAASDPAAGATGFVAEARRAAARWLREEPSLPDGARQASPYRGSGPALPFCLPVAHAVENLLVDARPIALQRFAAAGIPWHHGTNGGPSNHLLSSQVHCANTLAPFVDRPDALRAIFEPVLPIAQVLPFGAVTQSAFDATDHVVFEWIGCTDHLGEHRGGAGQRGANNTSADAAIRYRSLDGEIEIALIEWKYTEQYHGHVLSGDDTTTRRRHRRYRDAFGDAAGPIRHDLLDYEDFFAEPLYQLMRLQLLAWRMEVAHELGAQRVRLVVAAPTANEALATSFDIRRMHPGFAAQTLPAVNSVFELWAALQRRPDRFAVLDTAHVLTEHVPTSEPYRRRYGHIAEHGAPRHLRAPDRADANALRLAATMATRVMQRLSGDGGVLEQLAALPDGHIEQLPSDLMAQLTVRLSELGELSRETRASLIGRALHGVDEHTSGPEPEHRP